ncbi:Asp-tRNA(Asn)/Glu-tRNA(Gln) amidotransferase subunit GatC [Salinisphaera aquimarina]|uniref:Aspartyl/glutamyl-tRNA(Asn/Gln) amidotransferase subunit C n=1 Tax=Salinisphaera aquimarina TaxID=2094031 RepID=A0ABV7ETM7_9GAMM
MSLTTEQVRNVARLARLGLDEDQIAEYVGELSNIVDVFAALERVDTDAVEPMAHPLDLSARLRADEPVTEDSRAAFQAIAPATRDGVYLVPKVIE